MEKIYYFDEPKNDGYPVVQMAKDEKILKGFRWNPERRPRNRYDITSLEPRTSQRLSYRARPHAEFKETNRYFPGYINKIYKEIAYRDSMEVVRSREAALRPAPVDTLSSAPDSLTLKETADSLGLAPPADSLGATLPPVDSLAAATPADSLATPAALTPEEQKALEKKKKAEERARIKAEKQAAREAKWAEEDRIYAEKQAAKEQKKLNRERERKLKQLRRLEKKAQKERKIYEKYLKKELEKQARKKKK